MYSALFTACVVVALDPFDCYVESGAEYNGLVDITSSGRSCQKWADQKPHAHTQDTLGNHNYCRNPDSKEQPWCYTLDPDKEWEYCNVPACAPANETPTAWVSPSGLKSDEAEAEGPCEPPVDDTPKYVSFPIMEYGKELDPGSCKNTDGDKAYLIDGKLHSSESLETCAQTCLETAGAKFVTFWEESFEDGNCGCYRQCIPTGEPEDGAVNYPSTYKLTIAFLQQRKRRCKTSVKQAVPDLMHEAKVRAAKASEAPAVHSSVRPHLSGEDSLKLTKQLGDMMHRLGWKSG
jgi:hypothetical protein